MDGMELIQFIIKVGAGVAVVIYIMVGIKEMLDKKQGKRKDDVEKLKVKYGDFNIK